MTLFGARVAEELVRRPQVESFVQRGSWYEALTEAARTSLGIAPPATANR